ncbi:pilus assembly protein TadG-related protein [Loktanella agnita]|uniref:pilus assembly protein TadG-related protein n=1 Tax=Loktanella agnita TaxID=287097 RepID=UPI003987ABE9
MTRKLIPIIDPHHAVLRDLRRLLHRFRKDESGGLIILTLLLLIVMLVMGGMAVDFMRFESRRITLQSVSDRAVLAAASLDQTLPPEEVIEDYFRKAGFSDNIVGSPEVIDSGNFRTVRVEAAQNLNTFYLRLVGIDDLRVPAQSGAVEGIGKVEISLVLDISGSMRFGGSTSRGRFGDMQDAAIAFANKVLDPENGGQVSLNIVPYAGMTNPGPDMFSYLNGVRYQENLVIGTDEEGADIYFPQVSSCLEIDGADWDNSGMPTPFNQQVPHFQTWDIAADVMDWGWCPQDRSAIQYAFQDAGDAATFIQNIRMHDGTGTHYAMKYGLALLDPATQPGFKHLNSVSIAQINADYQAAIAAATTQAEIDAAEVILNRMKLVPDGFTNRPAAWDDSETTKMIILMTDGKITEQLRPNNPLDPVNLVDPIANQPGSPYYLYSPRETNRDHFYAMCDLAKSAERDVVVYTVAFETDAEGNEEMANCATSSATYFPASGAGLTTVFEQIAEQITDLRLDM